MSWTVKDKNYVLVTDEADEGDGLPGDQGENEEPGENKNEKNESKEEKELKSESAKMLEGIDKKIELAQVMMGAGEFGNAGDGDDDPIYKILYTYEEEQMRWRLSHSALSDEHKYGWSFDQLEFAPNPAGQAMVCWKMIESALEAARPLAHIQIQIAAYLHATGQAESIPQVHEIVSMIWQKSQLVDRDTIYQLSANYWSRGDENNHSLSSWINRHADDGKFRLMAMDFNTYPSERPAPSMEEWQDLAHLQCHIGHASMTDPMDQTGYTYSDRSDYYLGVGLVNRVRESGELTQMEEPLLESFTRNNQGFSITNVRYLMRYMQSAQRTGVQKFMSTDRQSIVLNHLIEMKTIYATHQMNMRYSNMPEKTPDDFKELAIEVCERSLRKPLDIVEATTMVKKFSKASGKGSGRGWAARDFRTQLAAQIVKLSNDAHDPEEAVKYMKDQHIDGGRDSNIDLLRRTVSLRLNAMVVGPAGSGKTYAAEQISAELGMDFYPISVGSQTSKSDLIGFINANGLYVDTPFRKAFEHGGVFLMDEIDAGNSNVLVVMNSALSSGFCSFPDRTIRKHEDFIFIATANTTGSGADRQYVGRNQLDAATLDRFLVIEWAYDKKLEEIFAGDSEIGQRWLKAVRAQRKLAEKTMTRVVISPRAVIHGVSLLESGASAKQVWEMTIGNRITENKAEFEKDFIESFCS